MKRVLMIAAAVLISSLTASAANYVATNLVTTANGGTGTYSQYLQGGPDSFRDQNGGSSTEVKFDGSGKAWVAATFGSVKTFNHLIVEQYPDYVAAGYEIQVANVANPDGNIDSNWTTVPGGSFSGGTGSSPPTINLSGNYTSAGVRLRATDTSNIPGADHQMRVREIYAYSNYSNLATTASVSAPGWTGTAGLTNQRTTDIEYTSPVSTNSDITFTWGTAKNIGAIQINGGPGSPSEHLIDYKIQYWNGASFVDLVNIIGNAEKTTYDLLSYPVLTTQLRLHITKADNSVNDGYARVAEVFIFEALPEPSSLSILGLGFVGILRRRARSL